ncbi:MAG: hypothetical protein IPJ65_03960 [Archangiaceae bacterium]|nr:hypothetical protein [Archangiaceae bacterium]
MSAAWLSLLLAAGWTDPTGRLRCEVPAQFSAMPTQPWRFSRHDGLRQLVFLTVKPVREGPAARARALLERAGAVTLAESVTPPRAGGTLGEGDAQLNAVFAIAALEPTWAGVMVLGPAAADALAAEADAMMATCRRLTPSVVNGRAFDATRRLSAEVPTGHDTLEIRGAGAVQGPGYTVRLTAVQPHLGGTLAQLATEWLTSSGARLVNTAPTTAGRAGLPAVVATGTLLNNRVEYLIEVVAIDLGHGEVGGLALSAAVPAVKRAQAAFDEMLGTLELATSTTLLPK